MGKALRKIKKFRTIRSRRIRNRRIRRRTQKIEDRKEINDNNKAQIENNQPITEIPPQMPPAQEDILSRYSKDRIDFLYAERENIINEYLTKEIEEFDPHFSAEAINGNMTIKRNCIIYCLYDILNNITKTFGYRFPENFKHSVIALYDYFLSKSNKEMKVLYMGRTMYACMDIIDKEEGIGVFLNEKFQKMFTTDDEIDVLEVTDFKLYPVKPFDYFAHFCVNAYISKRGDMNFFIYLKKLKEKFDEIAFYLLSNGETKRNKPSVNYCSIFSLAYDETKKHLPLGDNYINDYMNNFKARIKYSSEDYLLALQLYQDSIPLVEEAKIKYAKIMEEKN